MALTRLLHLPTRSPRRPPWALDRVPAPSTMSSGFSGLQRVGGALPTEQENDIGRLLGARHEFGTVTGAPDDGWFDAVMVRQA